METTEGFYKFTENSSLRYAANFVYAPTYSLDKTDLANLTLPIDGWNWYESQAAAEAALLTVETAPATAITQYAFRRRFTQDERVTMELAALDNPNATMPERQMAATLRTSIADVAAAKWVDLADLETVNGVENLEIFGIIGTGRAAQILSTAVLPSERP